MPAMGAIARRTLIASLALVLAAGAAARADGPPGGATPEAVYARLQGAVEAKDLAELSRCVAPADAAEMILGLYVGSQLAVAFGSGDDAAKAKAGEAKLEEILAAHGVEVKPEEVGVAMQGGAMPESLLALADPGALLADLEAFGTEMGLEQKDGEGPAHLGELSGVEIDGDTAHGTTSDGTVEFMRHGGRWYMAEGAFERQAAAEGGE